MTTDATDTETPAEPAVPRTARRTRRQRRPSGAAPPLPRHLGASGKLAILVVVWILAWVTLYNSADWAHRSTNQFDAWVLRQFAELRTGFLTDVAKVAVEIGSGYTVTAVGIALFIALVVLKRWRHLFTYLAAAVFMAIVGDILYYALSRPRPFDVPILGEWAGFSFPAAPVAVVTFLLLGILYSLVPHGRLRNAGKWVAGVLVGGFAGANLYLATYHPFDVIAAIVVAVAIGVNAFRFFTPNEVFPVVYGGGKTAHLDVEGRRGEAMRAAIHDQLGLTVLSIDPVGLGGSGGSTPLRICVDGDPDVVLFGKLYAMNHVRADRWYKLGRTLLYGRLEDEERFGSVRRLVEYEDYAARLFRESGIPTAEAYGIVEITPSREYLLLTEFFEGAAEIGDTDVEVDDGVIDSGLRLVRMMWDSGIAHRDIKPANLMVRDGEVLVIDTAFMQVRPSPWRQAIDLANMMLVLAVRTDAPRVYEHALRYFTPDEIAEAFAATRGVASPTQLRSVLKQDGRDLVSEFRALAPERRPIPLQKWSPIRLALALGLVLGTLLVIPLVVDLLSPADDLQVVGEPTCGTGDVMVLMAQAVPSARSVPCLASLPSGWELGGVRVKDGRGRFWLDSDVGGDDAVDVTLLPVDDCRLAGATEVPSDEVGLRRFERVDDVLPGLRSTRFYLFDGGCVRYRFDLKGRTVSSLLFAADQALAFEPRRALVDKVEDETGLRLCGAGAPCRED